MSLGHIAGRVDLVVHSKHRALALRLRINADAHRIQEITRPVKIGLKPTIAPSCAKTCTSAKPNRSFPIAATGNNRHLKKQRCAIPAEGFYEWRNEGGKQPYYFSRKDGKPLMLAGI